MAKDLDKQRQAERAYFAYLPVTYHIRICLLQVCVIYTALLAS